ncbi:MAG: hypothetical protein Q4C65_07735 [Eubacteriales bacterium]|nr:hypothetical protein [Eubacteriales bacterium]
MRNLKKWMAVWGLSLTVLAAGCGQSAAENTTASGQSGTESQAQGTQESAQASAEETAETDTVPAETEETAETAEADAEGWDVQLPVDGDYEGIVVDATMNNFEIRTREGVVLDFARPEEGSSLKDGLLLGIPVKVVYENETVTELTDGTEKPKADREAVAFAVSVMQAFYNKDMEALEGMIKYPVYVSLEGEDGETFEDAESLEAAVDASELFSAERCRAVLSVDLYELEELDGGKYVLSGSEGRPNVTFSADEDNDRGYSVTGIN